MLKALDKYDIFFYENGNPTLVGQIIELVLIIIGAKILVAFFKHLIDRWLKRQLKQTEDQGRVRTIAQMGKAVAKIATYFIGLMMVLDVFNINTASIIATAGIGSLAIGFGAQSLIKDLIAGFFLLWENQYAIGDLVKTEGFTGYVEEMGVRITKLRDYDGTLHIIPNGKITVVSNLSRGPIRALIKVSIAYEEDIDRAMKILQGALDQFELGEGVFIDRPEVLGVDLLNEYSVDLIIRATTRPDEQWDAERALRKFAKETLEQHGIKMPYPQVEIHKGE